MIRRPSKRKAVIRIAQGKPRDGIRCVTRMGRIIPPMEEPETTAPRARARCVRK
jgi:hypothetical protein